MQNDRPMSTENAVLESKYNVTAWFYDILDYPWERQYRRWRPQLLRDVAQKVLEAGVGTGRNLRHYAPGVELTGIDLSSKMLAKARRRSRNAACAVELIREDATALTSCPESHFDWVVSFFLCCVMPDALQPLAVRQFERVLKPGGRFRLLEMVYSEDPALRRRQEYFAPFVEKVYGARFDRDTLQHVENSEKLRVTNTYFLKKDIYLVIEGNRLP